MDRVRQLEDFLREDPDDPFDSYALALEYLKIDRSKARDLFEKLISDHPNYIPTYYTFAEFLSDQHDAKAEEIFRQGIEISKKHNDVKALKELSNAYQNWLFEQS